MSRKAGENGAIIEKSLYAELFSNEEVNEVTGVFRYLYVNNDECFVSKNVRK